MSVAQHRADTHFRRKRGREGGGQSASADPGSPPVTTLMPDLLQSLYEPTYRTGSGSPATRMARMSWHAVVPLPHATTVGRSSSMSFMYVARSSSDCFMRPVGSKLAATGALSAV